MIHIVTDTDSNLPQSVVDQYGIEMAPIHLIFGEEVVRERFDQTDAEVYARIDAETEMPSTSQPPVGEFQTIYERILTDEPFATILSIHISASLSGTISSARAAADIMAPDYPEATFHFFDTRSASLGQGLMVRRAADMVSQGEGIEAILAELERMRDGMHVYFILKHLDYLARSGRIGKASHLVGNLLDIKPLLVLEDGVIDAHSKHRTWRRALAGLRQRVADDAAAQQGLEIAVMHALSEATARDLADGLAAELDPDVVMFGELGPGIGIHTGPGTIGVCWYYPDGR